MRVSGLLSVLVTGLLALSAQAAPSVTVRVSAPAYLSGPVGRLFPDGTRVGGAAELGLAPGWSLSLEGTYLRKDWGGATYGLAIVPVMLRQEIPVGPPGATWMPFLSWGAGASVMSLFGGSGLQAGLGPTGAMGFGYRIAETYSLRLELAGGLLHDIRYLGLGLSLGLSARLPEHTSPTFEKPPLPEGLFTKVGSVVERAGDTVQLSLDELPYRVRPGDTLVIYYRAGVPIKIAKLRITQVSANGRTAAGRVTASTETIRRGYFVGTL